MLVKIASDIEKNPLKPIYVFAGFAKSMVESILRSKIQGLKVENVTVDRVEEELRVSSLWSQRKVLFLELPDTPPNLSYALSKPSDNVLVVWTSKTKIPDWLQDIGKKYESLYMLYTLKDNIYFILQDEAKKRKVMFSDEGIDTFLALSDDLLPAMLNDLEKLAIYIYPRREIWAEDVEDIMAYPKSPKLWEFVDNLLRGRRKEALSMVDKILEEEEAVYVLGAISRKLIALMKAKSLAEAGEISPREAMKMLGTRGMRNFLEFWDRVRLKDMGYFLRILKQISELDMKVKGGVKPKHEIVRLIWSV